MKQALHVLAAVVAASAATTVASQPGQPLDCSDMRFDVPGLTCRAFAGFGILDKDVYSTSGEENPFWRLSNSMAIDNNGNLYTLRTVWWENHSAHGNRVEVWRFDGIQQTRIAYIQGNRISANCRDDIKERDNGIAFDATNGRLLLWLDSYFFNGDCGPDYGGPWIAAIEGFATMYEILQTYTPTTSSLTFPVPYMPEGFEAADWFDTYWGSVTHPLNLADAHPLQCEYPPTPPKLGDRLTVADTVPTPAPGSAVYYVTAVNFQGQRRAGRQSQAGVVSGRNAAALPACITQ